MVLNDREILSLQNGKTPLIEPFCEAKLRGASYDLCITDEIMVIDEVAGIVDLSDQEAIDRLYSKRDIARGFILKPGQYILAQIAEKIALPDDVIARVMPRTRFTRLGVTVASQFCNPSYSGRLSIGIQNNSPNNIALPSGLTIAQLVFERINTPSEERLYRNQSDSAYHNERDFIGAQFGNLELTAGARNVYDAMLSDILGGN